MARGIPISEAVSLAMHSVAFIASKNTPSSVREISGRLAVSEFHLAKVLQRLVKSGILVSNRGPLGGFFMRPGSGSLTLLQVYESIEGPLKKHDCIMKKKKCAGKSCLLGNTLNLMDEIFRTHLSNTSVADLSGIYRQEAAHE